MNANSLVEASTLALMAEVSFTLVSDKTYAERMQTALGLVGDHFQASRVYIFLNSPDNSYTTNVFEWCQKGVIPQIQDLQRVAFSDIPSWQRLLKENGKIVSDSISDLPEDLRVVLEPQGIRSILVYPLWRDKHIIGSIGFDECQRQRVWSTQELGALRTLSGMFTSAMEIERLHVQEHSLSTKFSSLFSFAPVMMSINTVPDFAFSEVNDLFLSKLGYSRSEVLGLTPSELELLPHPEQRDVLMRELQSSKLILNMQIDLQHKNGRVLRGLFSGMQIAISGHPHYVFTVSDITAQQEYLRQLDLERFRLSAVVDATHAGVWELDLQSHTLQINERWAEICGYTVAELGPVSEKTWRQWVYPEDLVRADALLKMLLERQVDVYECEFRMLHKNGHWVWVRARGTISEKDKQTQKPLKLFGTHIDIDQEKRVEERIGDVSIRDPLTGIFNRRYFLDLLQTTLSESARTQELFGVAILDIDHFREINHEHGTAAGDQVLIDFTRIINTQIRAYDLQARYGGEEFILLLKGMDEAGTVQKVQKILDTVRNAIIYHGNKKISFTFSAGVVSCNSFSQKNTPVGRWIELAESRLAYAKESGRNCVKASQ